MPIVADAGDLVGDIHAGGTTYGYLFNALDRMVEVTQGGSAAGTYDYDFAGRRVYGQTYGGGAAKIAYVYDESGHLLAMHDGATGAMSQEFVWLDDEPAGLVSGPVGSQTTDYIHTGQIGEPLAVTNASQALVWNAYVDPYGAATNIGTPTVTLNMRLPGQWRQAETGGLHQNHWRDYDPSLGRYIEPDPLGVDAGQNVYAYVDGDPLNEWDVDGLAQCTYTISTHTLSCVPNVGGLPVLIGPNGVWSGVNGPAINCQDNPNCVGSHNFGPIVPGRYNMNPDTRSGHPGFWRLEPNPKIPGWMCILGLKRCGFEFHPGSISLGCITVDKLNPNAMKQFGGVSGLLNAENPNNSLKVIP